MPYMLTSMLNVSLEPVMSTTAFLPSHAVTPRPSLPLWLANALANVLTRAADHLRAWSQPVAAVASADGLGTPDTCDWMALAALGPHALKDIGAPAWMLAQVSARRDPGLDIAVWR